VSHRGHGTGAALVTDDDNVALEGLCDAVKSALLADAGSKACTTEPGNNIILNK